MDSKTTVKPTTRSVTEVSFRIFLCRQFIHILDAECSHDPRYEDARDFYQMQLDKLLAEAKANRDAAKKALQEKPSTIVIGLKTAR